MKVTKIVLKDYNQFKDVVIDLTYPKGHKKAGKPLDKVCFIGQSGTGKTSILRLIKWFVSRDRSIGVNIELPVPLEKSLNMEFKLFDLSLQKYNDIEGELVVEFYKSFSDKEGDQSYLLQKYKNFIENVKPILINFPTELIEEKRSPEDESRQKKYIDKMEEKNKDFYLDKPEPQQIIDFAFEDVKKNWDHILKDVKEHRAQELFLKNQIADAASQKDATIQEIEKKTKEYKKWLGENPNPLKMVAEKCLDPILYNLGLKTKTDLDLSTIRNLGFIELQTFAGQDIHRNFWSTGTRQLLQTAIPLYQLKPKDAIILIDEPERSLYPDIQRSIINTYVKLAPQCQFFFATHSPIIASAFEPWEVVELKFDEERNYVYQDLHYEGENHVDNYKYHPEYLRWDSILNRIFDLEEEGSEKRVLALKELAEINVRIRKLKQKNQLDSHEGKELVKKFHEMSQKLDWRTNG